MLEQSVSIEQLVHGAAPLELLPLLHLPPSGAPLLLLLLTIHVPELEPVLPLFPFAVPELLPSPLPLPLELAEPLPLLAPTPPLPVPPLELAPLPPLDPQSHGPKLLPSLAQACAPWHAPGPKHACVSPGMHPDVTEPLLPLHPLQISEKRIASAAATPSRIRPTVLDSAPELAFGQDSHMLR